MDRIKNHRTEFEKIFREYYSRLVGFATVFLKDNDAAEEIVMDVFEKFWLKSEETEIHSSLKSYLFKAVKNTCLNHLLKESRYDKTGDLSLVQDLNNSTHLNVEFDVKSKINEAIEGLPDRCREVFILSRIEGFKHKEIAEQLGISPKTVEVQIRKASLILKEKLNDYAPLLIIWLLVN